jgi:hypothetical protein
MKHSNVRLPPSQRMRSTKNILVQLRKDEVDLNPSDNSLPYQYRRKPRKRR